MVISQENLGLDLGIVAGERRDLGLVILPFQIPAASSPMHGLPGLGRPGLHEPDMVYPVPMSVLPGELSSAPPTHCPACPSRCSAP